MAKADQLLAVLWLLRSRSRMTAEQLAEQLETSVRTIYRYIDALCMSGVPVEAESGHGGGYRLPPTFRDAPLFFSIDELKAMVHAGQFAEQAGYPYTEPLRQATGKMQSRLSEEQAEQLQRHTTGFEVMQPSAHRVSESILQEIERAVASGSTLSIQYEKWKGTDPEERKVDPYGLVNRLYKWYLIGHCHLRGEMRVFRADRIAGASLTEQTFVRPESFSLREFMENRFELWHDPVADKPDQVVKLHGEPHSIASICHNWYMRDRVVSHSQTDVTLLLTKQTLEGFFPRYLLSFGKTIRIVEPVELRLHLAELARELADYYGDGAAMDS